MAINQLDYLNLASSIAKHSKDRSTKVAAVITNGDSIVATGYNGAVRGSVADEDIEGNERYIKPEKYYWIEHAERNAIYNAARLGIGLDGCSIYVTHLPCMDCSRGIIQSGIKTVYSYKPDEDFLVRWGEHADRSKDLFKEVGINLILI